MLGIGEELIPVAAREANGELVGIEVGAGDHGEDLAVMRVHGDDRAVLALERLFRRHLQIEVDGQANILARLCKLFAETPKLAAMRVDDDIARTVDTAEEGVIALLHAGFSDDIARG